MLATYKDLLRAKEFHSVYLKSKIRKKKKSLVTTNIEKLLTAH